LARLCCSRNLSYARLSKYPDELVEKGLLVRVEDGRGVQV